jgi:hypothetical protein
MTNEEILSLAEKIILSVSKNAYQGKDKKIVGVHDLYKQSVEMATHIRYHAVKGEFPDLLFSNRSPNQTEAEAKYIKANYKQYTLPEFVDYVNTITRPFGDGNWAIDYKEDKEIYKTSENTFQSYVEKELPIYGSLESFVKTILPTIKSIDANGFIAVRPKEIDYIDSEDGAIVDESQLYKPTIFYYKSENVIDYKHNEYYLFLSSEKSLIQHGDKQVRDGLIFELYTKDGVYFFKQIGKKADNKFQQVLFYEFNGVCPVEQLKGIPAIEEDEILWMSPFIFGVDLLDLVAVNSNWLQFSVNKCVFPMAVMYGSPCEFKDENGGSCYNGTINGFINDLPYQKSCPSCHGSGLKGRLSPLGTLLIKPTTATAEGETNSSQAPLSYVSPETTTLEFIEKKIDKDTIKARQILKLRNRNSIVNGQPITATEVFDDSKGMTAFIKPIADQTFNLYEFAIKHIGEQRYGENFEMPNLTYPKSYDFKNAEDYLIDLTTSIEKGLDISFIKMLMLQYVNAYYGDSEKTSNIFKLVLKANRLFGLRQDEINLKLANGTVAKWESVLNDSILNFISDLINESEEFLNTEIETQVKSVQDKAKEVATAIGAGVVDDIYKTV